ncbi:UBC-like protein [Mycena olivaceomarginata]|nr:UBC-like protein [Mycena olivaceomarginata]
MASKAAYKRLTKEYVTMRREPPPFVWAAPDEKNILTWNFLIRGPSDSPFAGGEYHGVLQFPAEYPFKPPGIKMLTPSGRFHPDKKICFSMSDFHPGSWNPAWSVATIAGRCSFRLSFPTFYSLGLGSGPVFRRPSLDSPRADGMTKMTTGSVTSSEAHKRAFAARSHAWNIAQPRFREAFPEHCSPLPRDLPNMGERERGVSAAAPPQHQAPQPLYVLPPHGGVGVDAAWTASLGKVLWEKWRWGLLIVLAVMVSRFSAPA